MSFRRTSSPEFSGRLHFWSCTKQGIAILLCVFVLSSCGPISSSTQSSEPAVSDSGSASAGTATASAPMPPLTGPAATGASDMTFLPNGLPAMQARGVNVDKMFSDRIKDEDRRFERVENAVKDLRREFDAVKPSILKLVAVEEDMQDLVAQLETLLQQEPLPAAVPTADAEEASMEDEAMDAGLAPPAPANARASTAQPAPDMMPVPLTPPPPHSQPPPVAAPPAPPPEPANVKPVEITPPPAAVPKAPSVSASEVPTVSGGATVRDLRIGEHEEKTRLVFDVTGPATYRYDIDNDEKLMIIELPGTEWAGKTQWTAGQAPLLASYTASPLDGGGSRVIVQLKQAVSVVYESKLDAGGGQPWRIVIDLGRLAAQ